MNPSPHSHDSPTHANERKYTILLILQGLGYYLPHFQPKVNPRLESFLSEQCQKPHNLIQSSNHNKILEITTINNLFWKMGQINSKTQSRKWALNPKVYTLKR